MNSNDILIELKKIISEDKIKIDEPMSKHTSFKIGGPAQYFVRVEDTTELIGLITLCKEKNQKLTVVGNGSNLLVTENGIIGIVAKVDFKDIDINYKNENVEIKVGAGVPLGLLAQKFLKEEITGFEELSGIPGTIGGAVVMNAGAHGKEFKDIVTEVVAIDYDGKIHKFSNEESNFEYRHSKFSEGNYIIIQSKIVLAKGKKEEIKKKMDEYLQYRKEKQPIEYPNAGSTFKRGADFITAKLIDECGLKGYSIGGAQISEKHAGFIINKGNAKSKDILDLVEYTKEQVYQKFGKRLDLEIQVLGE